MEWDSYFIQMAESVAKKSKDPSSQVGCIIVDKDHRVISTGYNGFVKGCDETKLSWQRPAKYFQIIHSEMNALLFAKRDLTGTKMYITDAPCENCLKHTLQAGIRDIVYGKADIMVKRGSVESKDAVRALIAATGANVVNTNNGKTIVEEFDEENS